MREMVCGDAIACRGTDEEEALEVVCRLQVRRLRRSTFFLAVFRVLFVRSIPFPRPHISVCNGDVWREAWHALPLVFPVAQPGSCDPWAIAVMLVAMAPLPTLDAICVVGRPDGHMGHGCRTQAPCHRHN